MAQRAGRLIRDIQEGERISAQRCPCCGHPEGEHKERSWSRWVIRDGKPVEVERPDDYEPNVFFCGHDGCDCKAKVVGYGRSRRLVAA